MFCLFQFIEIFFQIYEFHYYIPVMTVRESVVLTANKSKYVLIWFRNVIIKFPDADIFS